MARSPETALFSSMKTRHRGSLRTNLQVPVLRLKSLKFSRNLHSARTVLRLRCAWITMKKTRNFGYKSDKRRNTASCTYGIPLVHWVQCWFARTVWENLLYSSYLSISGTRLQHMWIIHAATQCTRGQQAIKWTGGDKSSIKPQPVL